MRKLAVMERQLLGGASVEHVAVSPDEANAKLAQRQRLLQHHTDVVSSLCHCIAHDMVNCICHAQMGTSCMMRRPGPTKSAPQNPEPSQASILASSTFMLTAAAAGCRRLQRLHGWPH